MACAPRRESLVAAGRAVAVGPRSCGAAGVVLRGWRGPGRVRARRWRCGARHHPRRGGRAACGGRGSRRAWAAGPALGRRAGSRGEREDECRRALGARGRLARRRGVSGRPHRSHAGHQPVVHAAHRAPRGRWQARGRSGELDPTDPARAAASAPCHGHREGTSLPGGARVFQLRGAVQAGRRPGRRGGGSRAARAFRPPVAGVRRGVAGLRAVHQGRPRSLLRGVRGAVVARRGRTGARHDAALAGTRERGSACRSGVPALDGGVRSPPRGARVEAARSLGARGGGGPRAPRGRV